MAAASGLAWAKRSSSCQQIVQRIDLLRDCPCATASTGLHAGHGNDLVEQLLVAGQLDVAVVGRQVQVARWLTSMLASSVLEPPYCRRIGTPNSCSYCRAISLDRPLDARRRSRPPAASTPAGDCVAGRVGQQGDQARPSRPASRGRPGRRALMRARRRGAIHVHGLVRAWERCEAIRATMASTAATATPPNSSKRLFSSCQSQPLRARYRPAPAPRSSGTSGVSVSGRARGDRHLHALLSGGGFFRLGHQRHAAASSP